MFVRKLVSLLFLVALALPVASQAQTDSASDRAPAATKHKKDKKKKAKKSGKAKKAKGNRQAKAKKKKSHAPSPRHESAAGDAGVSHTPPEMKDDLPAPSAESTTEQ